MKPPSSSRSAEPDAPPRSPIPAWALPAAAALTVVYLGMTMAVVVGLCFICFAAFEALGVRTNRIVTLGVTGAVLAIVGAVLAFVSARLSLRLADERWWRRRRLRAGRCPHCGYDIRHLDHPRCPECGEAFLALDPPQRLHPHSGQPATPRRS